MNDKREIGATLHVSRSFKRYEQLFREAAHAARVPPEAHIYIAEVPEIPEQPFAVFLIQCGNAKYLDMMRRGALGVRHIDLNVTNLTKTMSELFHTVTPQNRSPRGSRRRNG